eukprot:TRINITY_DN11623_c1_g2_i1.p1 TRINITY_DN11623_c1_g2~~TRINITY_DN11623_c1_g2_i1.p1  ORF type:complete len:177 (-),score=7.24 TRINITY_DN11623_c1_g2_i1:478-1008(-)
MRAQRQSDGTVDIDNRCSICLASRFDTLLTDCNHGFCAACVSRHLCFHNPGMPALCPNCRSVIRNLRGQHDGPDSFVVRYHSVKIHGLALPPDKSIHDFIGKMFGLDERRCRHLTLICDGVVIGPASSLGFLRNSASGNIGRPPVILASFPYEMLPEHGVFERVCLCFQRWWTHAD